MEEDDDFLKELSVLSNEIKPEPKLDDNKNNNNNNNIKTDIENNFNKNTEININKKIFNNISDNSISTSDLNELNNNFKFIDEQLNILSNINESSENPFTESYNSFNNLNKEEDLFNTLNNLNSSAENLNKVFETFSKKINGNLNNINNIDDDNKISEEVLDILISTGILKDTIINMKNNISNNYQTIKDKISKEENIKYKESLDIVNNILNEINSNVPNKNFILEQLANLEKIANLDKFNII
jgi:hypothetical protein